MHVRINQVELDTHFELRHVFLAISVEKSIRTTVTAATYKKGREIDSPLSASEGRYFTLYRPCEPNIYRLPCMLRLQYALEHFVQSFIPRAIENFN